MVSLWSLSVRRGVFASVASIRHGPEVDEAVVPGGGECLAVRREGQGVDQVLVGGDLAQRAGVKSCARLPGDRECERVARRLSDSPRRWPPPASLRLG